MGVAIDAADRIIAAGHGSGTGMVVRYDADGTLTTSTTQYVYSPRYIDAVICRDTSDGSTPVEGSRIYTTSDANYNVTAVLDAAGEVLERYTYAPYGQVTIHNADWSATRPVSIIDNANLYTGRVYDGAIDLYNFRARWYNAGVGAFTTRDPMGYDAGDENLYRYCRSRSTDQTDPNGLSPESDYNQALLDYYHRVLQQIMLVADELWGGGPSSLAERMPWYRIVNVNDDARGYLGNLSVQVAEGQAGAVFPKDWPQLQRQIAYVMKHYKKIEIGCVELSWLDQSSHNYGFVPGIVLNARSFHGDTRGAILALIHEPMHNMGDGILWLGFGHEHINPIAGVDDDNNVYGKMVDFLKTAQVRDSENHTNGLSSLWDAMLKQAGPRPKEPPTPPTRPFHWQDWYDPSLGPAY